MTTHFEGRQLLIATCHGKEKAIAPVLEKDLGVVVVTANDLETDRLGTFTGEVERKDDPLTTARKKCTLALQSNVYDLVIASEGSFGPHPSCFFLPADEELLVFIDRKNGLEIVVREISMETNFNGREVSSRQELSDFAATSGFPSHRLILRKSNNELTGLIKGISDPDHLESAFDRLMREYGTAYVQTDMRACYNPTRMQVIQKAAVQLSQKIRSQCPACGCPGFGVTQSKSGLRCGICSFPTRSTLVHLYGCGRCGFLKEEWYPHGKREEDPLYCDNCNP